MFRTIQVGDLALISVGNQQFSFPITSIDSSGIHTYEYIIIPVNNQWQVQGYPLPHTVSFHQAPARSSFTGITELNWDILLDLDYQALARTCQVNKKINKICQDDRFWREKVRKDFGVEKYKPEKITYRQQYRDLIETNDTDPAAEEGRLDELIVLEARNILPTQGGANWAAWDGQLEVLEWLAARNILSTRNGANSAAEKGQLEVLEWLAARNIIPTQKGVDNAAGNGHLEVLEWLRVRNILHTQRGASLAAASGQIQVLEWLAARNILPTQEGANWAAGNGYLQVLEWLAARNILPTQQAANWAAKRGHMQVLEWLAAHGIYPTEK